MLRGDLRPNQYAVRRLLACHGALTAPQMARHCTLHEKQCHKAATELVTLGLATATGRAGPVEDQVFRLVVDDERSRDRMT